MKILALNAYRNMSVSNFAKNLKNRVLYTPQNLFSAKDKISFSANPLLAKYTKDFYGLSLLNQTNTLNRNSKKYDDALKFMQNVAFDRLFREPEKKLSDKKHPVIWSVTSEFAPVKEGGLGSVPPEIRNNSEKLGVNMPTFIPMYLNEGSFTFYEENGKYTYSTGKKDFSLEKAVSFKMDTFQNGAVQTIPVDIFLSEDYDENNNKRQLIFVKTDKYFDGTIYETSAKTEENEKFAVFSKAVYEFAKLKIEGARALKDVHIISSEALNKIKEPDAMLLNDWQASPVASLMRYKAPMENAYNQLSDKSAEKMRNMTIATIGHNCAYQGSTLSNNNQEQKKEASENILNTLFDKYASDIVKHANTFASRTDYSDRGLVNLDNALVMNYQNPWESSVNFLNMGVVLSDYFLPVSQNYAQELTDEKRNDLSGLIQWALVQKAKTNRMIGIINGNDYKNLNIEAKAPQIKKTTGIDFKTYNANSLLEEIINARNENKFRLYSEYMRPALNCEGIEPQKVAQVKQLTSLIEFHKCSLPETDKETLDKTPVLSVVGRLVSQKGVDVAVEAIEKLYNNWENEFPHCEKPIIYIAGMDNEGGAQRKKIEELLDKKLKKDDASRVVFAHGFVPASAIMAGSDFFLMPSKFEPCGLTQGESMAVATPVIASAVGGIVDTVNRNGKHTGFLTNKDTLLSADEFYSTIIEGLNTYFYNPEEYCSMVKDCLSEDFSWIQKGKKGPVYDYLELFGIKRETLSDAG